MVGVGTAIVFAGDAGDAMVSEVAEAAEASAASISRLLFPLLHDGENLVKTSELNLT